VNQLAAQACKALAVMVEYALAPAGALRCEDGAAGCRLAGDVPSAWLAEALRVGPDIAAIQKLAGRLW
jgi:hypothetical protein